MTTMAPTYESWTALVRDQAWQVQSLLHKLRDELDASSFGDFTKGLFLAAYEHQLDRLLNVELPLARALDTSDLLFHAEGPSIAVGSPKVSLVMRLLKEIRDGYTGLTSTISGCRTKRVPPGLDLCLSSVSPGSLYLAFNPVEDPRTEQNLLPDMPSHAAVARQAMATLASASRAIAEGAVLPDLASVIPDPGVRDAAVSALERLAPSTRSGLESVTITARTEREMPTSRAKLTSVERDSLVAMCLAPVLGAEQASFQGRIRAIDLDRRRCNLRATQPGSPGLDLRCAYGPDWVSGIKELLDRDVVITGRVEYGRDQRPRLCMITDIRLGIAPSRAIEVGLPFDDDD